MDSTGAHVSMADFIDKLHVTVTIDTRLTWRIRVGLLIMRFGAWIIGIGFSTTRNV